MPPFERYICICATANLIALFFYGAELASRLLSVEVERPLVTDRRIW